MFKHYKTPVVKASPDIKLPEPRISKFTLFLLRIFGRLYLFLFYGIARTIARGGEKHLFEAFKRALEGKSRCVIAFRHPNGGEPQMLTWYILFRLKGAAAKMGIRLPRWPHAVFVYSYEVVRWGGWVARFIMPNAGAMPIHHAKMDTQGMNRILNAITDGKYPLALAPEGQVSYTTDTIPRLEPGVIRLGFQAAERVKNSGSDSPVEILPVSIHYSFGVWGRWTIDLLLRKIEKLSGFSRKSRKTLSFEERLRQCREHILEVNEGRYNIKPDDSFSFNERLEKVIYAALETAERIMGLKSEGEYFHRVYRLRQFCWDRIFLPGVDNFDNMSPIERNVKDLQAGEAWHAARHQEIVDFCWYFRVPLPAKETGFHLKVEYVQNLWDFANRTMGGAYPDRKSILPRKVIIQSAPVINLSERLPAYHENKKAAVAAALADLEKAYLDCITEANEFLKK